VTVIVGIDPGNSGALAFLDVEACSLRIIDMPTFEFETTKKRVSIDPYGIVAEMQQYDLHHVYMEEVYSSPQMGVVSAFNFGEGKGKILGIVAAMGVPVTSVKPARWKKDMKVPADKRAAVQRASQLFPGAAPAFKGPRGGVFDGRAEAALLALYGALELGVAPTAPVTLQGE
jgi:hypothetical protein